MEFSLEKVVNNGVISTNLQSKMIVLLKEQFTQEEQEWYIGNLYMYMNYHPTNDFIINLDHVFKMIGFATKGNAKRTIENNFTKDEDYKIISIKNNIEKQLLRTEKLGGSGVLQEDILLNVDTFKNLCMIAKTEKGKTIRKYYVKLENIYNQLIKEEIQQIKEAQETTVKLLEEKEKCLEEKEKCLEEKAKINEELVNKNKLLEQQKYKDITYEEISKAGHVYIFSCDQPGTYKCGRTKNVNSRVKGLQTACVQTIQVLFDYPTNNDLLLETAVHHILDRYRCNSNREHFRCDLDYMKRIVTIVGKVLDTLKSSYQTISENELMQRLEMKCIEENRNVLSLPDPYQNSFSKWLDENLIYSYGDILQLNTICEDFMGRKVSPRSMSQFRKELENYIAKDTILRDKRVNHQMQDSSYNGQKYKGYLHVTLK
jgi:phage anti-repressor protein